MNLMTIACPTRQSEPAPCQFYKQIQHAANYITVISYNKMSTPMFVTINNSKDWEQQLACLEQMPLTVDTAKSLNCPKNSTVVKNLLGDSRSKLVVSMAQLLTDMFEKFGMIMNVFAVNLLGTDVVFKLLNSSNKIIFSAAHELVKAIVVNSPNPKLFGIFVNEFNSKNVQVRESISSYILVLAQNLQIPAAVLSKIRGWKNDPSKKVRSNVESIQKIMDKMHECPDLKPLKQDKQNKENIDNFMFFNENGAANKIERQVGAQIIKQRLFNKNTQNVSRSIEIALNKINSSQHWNIKIKAIQELCQLCTQSPIETKLCSKTIATLMDLLGERRIKFQQKVHLALDSLIQAQQTEFKAYVESDFIIFIQKAVKSQQFGPRLIKQLIDLNHSKYLTLLCQTILQIRPVKQKLLLLDLTAQLIPASPIDMSRATTIAKVMYQLIDKYHNNRQFCGPCLAVLSHFVAVEPRDFVKELMRQESGLIAKIIEAAGVTDNSELKAAILDYIDSDKNQYSETNYNQISIQDSGDSALASLLHRITQEQHNSIEDLAEYIFSHPSPQAEDYYQIIKLTEQVTSQDTLVELQMLLQSISKSKNELYIEALFSAIAACNQNSIQSEYILSYLKKLQVMFSDCNEFCSRRYAGRLISLYRCAKCPRVRLLCVKILSGFGEEELGDLTEKQKCLVEAHLKHK